MPPWANAAFASRCASRALPFFGLYWPNAPQEFLAEIQNAVTRTAEEAEEANTDLYTGCFEDGKPQELGGARAAAAARSAAAEAEATSPEDAAAVVLAACAADAATLSENTAQAAFAADEALEIGPEKVVSLYTEAAAKYARKTAIATAFTAALATSPEEIMRYIRANYSRLTSDELSVIPDHYIGVPQSTFGELWPEGQPLWITATQVNKELLRSLANIQEFEALKGASPAPQNALVNALDSISELHKK